MKPTPLVILGGSGHARVALDIIKRRNEYCVIGVVLNEKSMPNEVRFGLPVLGSDRDLGRILEEYTCHTAFVAVGDNFTRMRIVSNLRMQYPRLGYATAIHPNAAIGDDVTIHMGSVVMAGAVINSGTRIGEFCIVNSSASIDHDSELDDYASVAPGVVTGGNVKIGRGTAICLGASIIHQCDVGENSVIGSGSLVLRDVPSNVVAYGSPARVIRSRQAGDRYL